MSRESEIRGERASLSAAVDQSLDQLSDCQLPVACHVARGLSDQQIAAEVGRTPDTVKKHIAAIARVWKLDPGRSRRVQIAVIVTQCLANAA